MTPTFDPLPEVMRHALLPGKVGNPTALIAAVAAVDDPVSALEDLDRGNELFAALDEGYRFIQFRKNARQLPQGSDLLEWASLVRWLMLELEGWCRTNDPDSHRLVAMFIVVQVVDWEGQFWEGLPPAFKFSTDLIETMKQLVTSTTITFAARGNAQEPVWEREAVNTYERADAVGDWVAIANGLRQFERQFVFGSVLRTQAVRCLYRCDRVQLVVAIEKVNQTVVAVLVASALPKQQRLTVAMDSENPYIQFGCLYHTLTHWPVPKELFAGEQDLLTLLLLKVANDQSRWLGWMQVFNAYPMRYPILQVPLGRALAKISQEAIEAYVNSIVLFQRASNSSQPDHSRLNVATCLREFRAIAAPERRKLLWSSAHRRWADWRFDQINPDAHLFAIAWTELDYAVVGFACECLDDAGRKQLTDKVQDALQMLEDRWHNSITSIVTEFNRLLSQMQPVAHASHIILNGGDWLQEGQNYLPFDPTANQYLAKKYRLG